MMADITRINQTRVFTGNEALRILPVVRRVTGEAVTRAEALAAQYEALPDTHPSRIELERELQALILTWAVKIQKLGAHAKGLWLVDFDLGDRIYGWRYGDAGLRRVS